jgi:ferredoxin-NADP reductase
MSQASADSGDRTVVVAAKTQVAEGVVRLTLARPDGGRLPDWTPGAHVDLLLPDGTGTLNSTIRQYSLCGDRWDARRYEVAVRREPHAGGSAYVHDTLQAGDVVGIGGPRNNFPLVPAPAYTFIAGGIGITPLLPMIVQADLLAADWTLLYAGRSRASMAFLPELARFGERVRVLAADEGKRPDLAGWLDEPRPGRRVYCCGPDRMLTEVRSRCAAWPAHTLRTERFTPAVAAASASAGPFELELARTGARVPVAPGTSVLDAALAAGASILSSCRRGLCGTCEVTVLAGQPEHRDSLLDDEERAVGDSMFVCVSRSAGPRLVLDL